MQRTARHGLGKLSPTRRLLAFVALSLLVTVAFTWQLAFAALVLGATLVAAGRSYPRALLVGCLVTALLTLTVNAVALGTASADGGVLASVGDLYITDATLELGLTRGARIAGMMLIAIAFIAVTTKHEMLLGARGLGLRGSGALYAMIVLRYIDIFEHEFETTIRAVKVRGKRIDDGPLFERIGAYASLLMPLMARAVNRAQVQALAVDARGLRGKRTAVQRDADAAIALRDVGVFYGTGDPPDGQLPLEINHFEVRSGETVYVIGQTGAGKTTLLLTCSGLIPQSLGRMRGAAHLFGNSTRDLPMTQLARLGRFLFANPVHGLVGITVRDELELSCGGSEEASPSATEALTLVGLGHDFMDRSTLHLSGGEMQRVQLASALLSDASLILLDEPTVQLDPQGKREVLDALRWLRERRQGLQSLTMVIADPSVERMLEEADRVAIVDDGRLATERPAVATVADDLTWMKRNGLRVPQRLRLEQRLGRRLPDSTDEIVSELRDAARDVDSAGNGAVNDPALARTAVTELRHEHPKASTVARADGVSFQYQAGTRALAEINYELRAGEFVFLLGSNGSGKSTLSLVLAGALQPSSGTVERPAGGHVGYVFQEPSLQILSTTVRQELAFGPRNLGRTEEDVEQLVQREVERFGLDPDANPLDLSPAESRKLAIASLLTMEPTALILDEPTNGLDEHEVRDLFSYLTRLNADGVAVMVVTHDVELACDYGNRVLVMHQGQILLDATPQTAFADVATLRRAQVEPPPIVTLSQELWPGQLPALTVEDFLTRLGPKQADPIGPGEPASAPVENSSARSRDTRG